MPRQRTGSTSQQQDDGHKEPCRDDGGERKAGSKFEAPLRQTGEQGAAPDWNEGETSASLSLQH